MAIEILKYSVFNFENNSHRANVADTTMVLLTLTKNVNKFLGPFLLRQGLKARYVLGRGVLQDNPMLDSFLFIPLAQKLISLEISEEIQRVIRTGNVEGSWLEYYFPKKSRKDDEYVGDSEALRLQILGKYLRPALIRNELWSDVKKWQFHHRTIRWVRTEYLLAKYGAELKLAMDIFPALRRSPQIVSKQKSDAVLKLLGGKLPFDNAPAATTPAATTDNDKQKKLMLPTTRLVVKAFGMENWKQQKNLTATGKEMARVAKSLGGKMMELRGGGLRIVHDIPDNADLSKLSLGEILELVGGHVSSCGMLNALCDEADIYQLWTTEYVEKLGTYLLNRTEAFQGDTVILDVGAGDGLLAQFLREFFEHGPQPQLKRRNNRRNKHKSNPRPTTHRKYRPTKTPTVVATDNGSWRISQKAEVERLSVDESIQKYANGENCKQGRQVIVLCSWMPMNEDWSAIFRTGGVDEYILVGECDDGQCGDNWETWGNKNYLSDLENEPDAGPFSRDTEFTSEEPPVNNAGNNLQQTPMVPYLVDGYQRRELDDLAPYQLSRFDCSLSKSARTISFRRA